jgi:hypothetical protein
MMTLQTLTEAQQGLLPTDDEVRFYQQHGYYHSRSVFTDDEIEAALEGSERFYAGEIDAPPSGFPASWYPKGEYGPGLRKHDYASLMNRGLAGLVRHPLVGAIAARLAETPEIRLWHDQLLYKPPDRADVPANVGWHTDRGYWKTCSSANMLTAWIPFHDCDETMGTITMIDGSLHWPDNTAGLDFFSSDLEGLESRFRTDGQPVVKVPMNLKRGQISFHHCLTIHGSGPNRSPLPRRSIAVHLQDASNHWQEYRFADGRLAHHSNDDLCRRINGVPDYTDPDICPALYREA